LINYYNIGEPQNIETDWQSSRYQTRITGRSDNARSRLIRILPRYVKIPSINLFKKI